MTINEAFFHDLPSVNSVVMTLVVSTKDSKKVSVFLVEDFHKTFPVRNMLLSVRCA